MKNTLNNPWISNFKSIDSSYFFGQRKAEPSQTIKIVYSKINNILGEEIFVGSWELVDQNCIDGFATLTGDDQWIHTNKERAKKESPFKTTIAHGFLTLSLIPKLTESFNFNDIHPNVKMVVNYGLNKVRFPYQLSQAQTLEAH